MYRYRKLTAVIGLLAMLVSLFAGCSTEYEVKTVDVLAGIDPGSVVIGTEEMTFTANLDGRAIGFFGYHCSYDSGILSIQPGGFLASVDAVGQIHGYKAAQPDGLPEDSLQYVAAYHTGSMTAVDTPYELNCFVMEETAVQDLEASPLDCSAYRPNFIFVACSKASAEAIRLGSLEMKYAPEAPPFTLYYEPDLEMPVVLQTADEMFVQQDIVSPDEQTVTYYILKDDAAAPLLLVDKSVCTQMDLLASIDRESIVESGDEVTFTAKTPAGESIRFWGKHLQITESTLRFENAEARLFSLDSIGQIHGYDARYVNGWDPNMELLDGYAYTFQEDKTSVESIDELIWWPFSQISDERAVGYVNGLQGLMPNFVLVSCQFAPDGRELEELTIYYDPSVKTTPIRKVELDTNFYGFYLEGEKYDVSREAADLEGKNMPFYLRLELDTPYSSLDKQYSCVNYVPEDLFTIGDLKDASGKILDKQSATMTVGTSLDVTVGDYQLPLELPTYSQFTGGRIFHDLVPYAYPEAAGDARVLVIPVVFPDQTDKQSEETLNDIRRTVGRVMDANGEVSDYSVTDDEAFSLSEYFDTASYGKYRLTSFITDWVMMEEPYEQMMDRSIATDEANRIFGKIVEAMPDMDWSQFDRDANGYFDSVILISTAQLERDGYQIMSWAGGYNHHSYYTGDHAGTQDMPHINDFSLISMQLPDFGTTVIHEFGHGLGLIDYYDVTYSGIDAVGHFDMQSGSYGDWNGFSKMAVGWIEPKVVENLASGESVEVTIGSLATHDDLIVIPAAGTSYDGPFGEYIMVDLFTDDGTNRFDAADPVFNLTDAAGVRISHVNGMMETHIEVKASMIEGHDDTPVTYELGTPHYVNSFNEKGQYQIEVIQKDGVNTFTAKNAQATNLSQDDLFAAGDSFSLATHADFFYEGRMDDGRDFGYTVEVVDLFEENGETFATVRITAH